MRRFYYKKIKIQPNYNFILHIFGSNSVDERVDYTRLTLRVLRLAR